jgi:hypothetical protein
MRLSVEWRRHVAADILEVLGIGGLSLEPYLRTSSLAMRTSGYASHQVGNNLTILVTATTGDWLAEVWDFSRTAPRLHERIRAQNREIIISGIPAGHCIHLFSSGKRIAEYTCVRQGPNMDYKIQARSISSAQSIFHEHTWALDGADRLPEWLIELFGAIPSDWRDLAVTAAPGLARAIILTRLGAPVPINERAKREWYRKAIGELSNGSFESHFPGYWRQLGFMLPHCRERGDWHWAARHLIPPCGSAYHHAER